MATLVLPDPRWWRSWLAARDEWGGGTHQPGAGLGDGDDLDTAAGFRDWVGRLLAQADPATPLPADRVPATYWWVVDGDDYLGAITLRHRLTAMLLEGGGHIGYGIRPSARGRGLATWALGRTLTEAARLGLDRVLVTCATDNPASARVIERNGGILEDVRDTWLGRTRRYWIRLPQPSPGGAGSVDGRVPDPQ